MTVITSVSVLQLFGQGGADPGEDKDEHKVAAGGTETQKGCLGQQTEKIVTCASELQKAPAQPQPSAQQSLLLPRGTQEPQSWDTLKMP